SEPGTAVDMRGMDRILSIGNNTVVVQAGAIFIDVAKELEKHNLQFYVHIELGNISMGAAACSQTKDASFTAEYGTFSSYAIGMKAVLPSGEVIVITEEQPELLQAMRSCYGLLGIIFEVTFRVKPIRPMAFHHEHFTVDELERQLPALVARGDSMMYYLYPFQDRLTVEFRRYLDAGSPSHSFAWKVRNYCWATLVPALGKVIRTYVPAGNLRAGLFNILASSCRLILNFIRGDGCYPADQVIRYPHPPGYARYTFSLWAFPEKDFVQNLRAYNAFCRDYYRDYGYRCDLVNVGYRMNQDQRALLSFTCDGSVLTIDPACSGGDGWFEFLDACNEFCSARGASLLYNQTPRLTPGQVQK
ncbi:MAG: FAD-binding oxidoreductase, partial [Bryobacteraceae bacterium]